MTAETRILSHGRPAGWQTIHYVTFADSRHCAQRLNNRTIVLVRISAPDNVSIPNKKRPFG